MNRSIEPFYYFSKNIFQCLKNTECFPWCCQLLFEIIGRSLQCFLLHIHIHIYICVCVSVIGRLYFFTESEFWPGICFMCLT